MLFPDKRMIMGRIRIKLSPGKERYHPNNPNNVQVSKPGHQEKQAYYKGAFLSEKSVHEIPPRAIPFEILRGGTDWEKISDAPHTFYFFRRSPPIHFLSRTP